MQQTCVSIQQTCVSQQTQTESALIGPACTDCSVQVTQAEAPTVDTGSPKFRCDSMNSVRHKQVQCSIDVNDSGQDYAMHSKYAHKSVPSTKSAAGRHRRHIAHAPTPCLESGSCVEPSPTHEEVSSTRTGQAQPKIKLSGGLTQSCQGCGDVSGDHLYKSRSCPAAQKTCSFCRHSGHLESCCGKKQKASRLSRTAQPLVEEDNEKFSSIRRLVTTAQCTGNSSTCSATCLPLANQSMQPSSPSPIIMVEKPGSSVETSSSKMENGSPPSSTKAQSMPQQTAVHSQVAPPPQQSAPPPQLPRLQCATKHMTGKSTLEAPSSQVQDASLSKDPTPPAWTLVLQGNHGWTPFRAQIDMDNRDMSIPLQLYRRHFKHQPLSTVHTPDGMESKGIAGSFSTDTRYKDKIVFLHVFVCSDSSAPIVGTKLINHFSPKLGTSPFVADAFGKGPGSRRRGRKLDERGLFAVLQQLINLGDRIHSILPSHRGLNKYRNSSRCSLFRHQ